MTFQEYLTLQGHRKNTVQSKWEYLQRLTRETSLDLKRIQEYLDKKRLSGVTATYLNKLVKVLREYDQYCGTESFKDIQYFKNKGHQSRTSMFTENELLLFFSVKMTAGQSRLHYVRFKTFFYALATTGCRPSEIASLSLTGSNRLDLGADMIFLNETKTIPRTIPVIEPLKVMFQEYIKLAGVTDNLFEFKTRNIWEQAFNRWLDRAGIQKRVGLTPYSFRRTFITNTLQHNAVLFDVQNLVGHQSAESTQVYYFPNRDSKIKAIKKLSLLSSEITFDDVHALLVEWLCNVARSDLRHSLAKDGKSITLKIWRS